MDTVFGAYIQFGGAALLDCQAAIQWQEKAFAA
ncbi:hypothetical protein GQ600_25759 [Phytophthora cactorum]|nr:hypothetical protein GQ600_25759 [Phytophthora cactorum]